MNKEKRFAFGKNIYLLGKNQNGKNCWLEAGSWDCDWYWGFGYVETYTNNAHPEKARDIDSHSHFNHLFLKNGGYVESFRKYFKETPLSEKEIWKLLELMETFYQASTWADTLYRGGSNVSINPLRDTIKNNDEYERINKVVIPAIMEEVYKLLSPKVND